MVRRSALYVSLFTVFLLGCGSKPAAVSGGAAPGADTCRPRQDKGCFQIDLDGHSHALRIPTERAVSVDDGGVTRNAVPLAALFDEDVVADPTRWRYKLYATDGFTHGGYATWDNLQHGYIEVGTRKVFFDASQNLSHSFRIKDAYRIELLPP